MLVHEGSPPVTRIDAGPGAVLQLFAKWGELPFVYDTGEQAKLDLELPASPVPGVQIALGDHPSFYIHGGQIESFVSRTCRAPPRSTPSMPAP